MPRLVLSRAADVESMHARIQANGEAMKRPILVILALAGLSAVQGKQTFTGVITDSVCSTADHSQMQMAPTAAECVTACISEHGATYVLYDGKNIYELSDQKTPEKFAAQKVRITGTLDAKGKTIHVDSISATSPAAFSGRAADRDR
jgi:hypothetical protein